MNNIHYGDVGVAKQYTISKIKLNSSTRADTWTIESEDVLNIIAGFLYSREAVQLLYVNKTFYAIFLMPFLRNSVMSINTDKIASLRHSNIYKIFTSANMHIAGIKKIKEPLFLYIEKMFMDKAIPDAWANLRYISFGRTFNYPINELPPNVEEIVFHPKSLFNQKVAHLRCTKLKRIYFGKFFNQKIDWLPQSIEVIHFDHTSRFNMPIQRAPAQLRELYFGQWFDQELDVLWRAPRLERLQFTTRSRFSKIIAPAPALHTLSLGMYYNAELDLRQCELRVLRFHKLSRFDCALELPYSIHTIIFGEYFNQPLPLHELPNLVTLQFYAKSKFNMPLMLPASCRVVVLGRHFCHTLAGEGLRTVKFAKNSKFRDVAVLQALQSAGICVAHSAFGVAIAGEQLVKTEFARQ